jgi:PD-(D/E)XK endonuclease
MNTREQGDFGERSAMLWLWGMGYRVAVPLGHSPHWDLIAELRFGLARVQVKTSTCARNGRWLVALATRGGNQSWNGLVKRLDPDLFDYLFVHVGDGRRWFIPSNFLAGELGAVAWGTQVRSVGDRAGPANSPGGCSLTSRIERRFGGIPKRSTGCGCKPHGSAFAGSNPAPPISRVPGQTAPGETSPVS